MWVGGAIVLTFLFGAAGSIQHAALRRVTAAPRDGAITVESASFGENCNPQLHNNALNTVRRICNSEAKCGFDYDVQTLLGDPAGGCLKRFRIVYRCGTDDLREFLIPEFIRASMPIAFGCHAAK
jgi:hypothetical protein